MRLKPGDLVRTGKRSFIVTEVMESLPDWAWALPLQQVRKATASQFAFIEEPIHMSDDSWERIA